MWRSFYRGNSECKCFVVGGFGGKGRCGVGVYWGGVGVWFDRVYFYRRNWSIFFLSFFLSKSL